MLVVKVIFHTKTPSIVFRFFHSVVNYRPLKMETNKKKFGIFLTKVKMQARLLKL